MLIDITNLKCIAISGLKMKKSSVYQSRVKGIPKV